MRSRLSRLAVRVALGAAALVTLLGAGAPPRGPVLQSDQVVICTLSDVKGKTSPCGCHIPKGGLARQASFLDSVRVEYGQSFFVDAGGYFPEDDAHRDAAWFLMDSYMLLGIDAVGVGPRDLRFGVSYLRESARARKLPVVCANLLDRASGRPVFPATTLVARGRVKVGFFGLLSAKADLGPSRDSLTVSEPEAAARAAIAELRRKGATVVVALSDLGKVESEDLATAVPGLDVIVAAYNVPVIQLGRVIQNTLMVYGGEQGQNIGRVKLGLGPDGRSIATRAAEVAVLTPQVPDKPEMLQMVKGFESALNEKLRKAEMERATQRNLAVADRQVDHFVGTATCERCHPAEAAQWRTTAHARAWRTLVDDKKDADPACAKCHTVGAGEPGGFQNAQLSKGMTDVGCESCHGMGTRHDAFTAAPQPVAEATCRGCHDAANSPAFAFDLYRAHVVHTPVAGLPELPQGAGGRKAVGAAVGH
jgi:2',3'-cyclic-nucleotide 2'-phosphodiesterase (5'-nucleotidase family)